MILGTISDSQLRVSFKDIKEIMSQFPADISTKDANLFSDCVIHNEPFVSLWTYLHIDKISYTKREHFSVNMFECEIDVVEIKIPD